MRVERKNNTYGKMFPATKVPLKEVSVSVKLSGVGLELAGRDAKYRGHPLQQ
jgi:hypothetical protein